jgi:membrane protease subunit HflK
VLTEYQKAPQVTRDRMYIESMQQIYSNVTKVLVESRQGSNLLYLPLDKIMQGVSQTGCQRQLHAGSACRIHWHCCTLGNFPDSRITRDPNRSRERESR